MPSFDTRSSFLSAKGERVYGSGRICVFVGPFLLAGGAKVKQLFIRTGGQQVSKFFSGAKCQSATGLPIPAGWRCHRCRALPTGLHTDGYVCGANGKAAPDLLEVLAMKNTNVLRGMVEELT